MKVRSALALAIAATLLVGGTDAAGDADRGGGKIRVACIPQDFVRIEFKAKPKHCIFVKRGAAGFGYEILGTKSLKWDHWGRPHAHGEGVALFNMGSKEHVKVLLSHPKSICGHRVYSKAKFKIDGRSHDQKLDTCPRYLRAGVRP